MTLKKHISRRHYVLADDASWLWPMNAKTATQSIREMLSSRILKSWRRSGMQAFFRMDLDRAFIWTIVRNPWDRVVSAWEHLMLESRGKGEAFRMRFGQYDFDGFITECLAVRGPNIEPHFWQQTHSYMFRGARYAEFIARFETIANDWPVIASRIDAPEKISLHRHVRKNRGDWRSRYTPRTMDIVASLYREDIAQLGYEF